VITLLAGFPDQIIAVSCSGHVTKSDYERVLIPAVEAALQRHDKVRLLYRAGPEFDGIDPGAVFEDMKVGFAHLSRWERVAIVTNVEWIRLAIRAFAFLMPGTVRFFTNSQEAEARDWIVQP
jgi:SpoIIAA-like